MAHAVAGTHQGTEKLALDLACQAVVPSYLQEYLSAGQGMAGACTSLHGHPTTLAAAQRWLDMTHSHNFTLIAPACRQCGGPCKVRLCTLRLTRQKRG